MKIKYSTSDDNPSCLWYQGILILEAGGCNLTDPVSIIIFHLSWQNPQGAILHTWSWCPLIFARMNSYWQGVSLPPALPLFVEYFAWKYDWASWVDLLVAWLLYPFLQEKRLYIYNQWSRKTQFLYTFNKNCVKTY